MDRWIGAEASREFLSLETRVRESTDSEPRTVPTVRGWADALLATRARERDIDGPTRRIGSYVISESSANAGPRLLVAAERCALAQSGGLVPLLSGPAWREAKRFLVEQGWRQDDVEELVTPTTSYGMAGRVDPELVAEWIQQLDSALRDSLLQHFMPVLDAYISSWSELKDLSEDGALPPNVEVIVPWDGVMAVRDEGGRDHIRAS